MGEVLKRFRAVYKERFRIELEGIQAKIVNVNTSVIGVRPPLDLSKLIDPAGRMTALADAQNGQRRVFFDGVWLQAPIYWRDKLPLNFEITGPAIVEQMDTTVLLEPGDVAKGDALGNMIIRVGVL